MEERIKAQNVISLIPSVYYRLSTVKEGEFSYRYYEVRHPGAIFSIHLQETLESFNALSLAINNIQATGSQCTDEEVENLKALTLNLLFNLNNYFESGYEIFLCFCNQHAKPPKDKPLYQWFNTNGYQSEISPYFSAIDSVLGIYRRFFNALKYSSNRIMLFQFFKPDMTQKVMGFYLEGVNEQGVIEPVSEFHPSYEDMFTAWSYNFFLFNIYFLIYKIAQEIENSVELICKKNKIVLSNSEPFLVYAGIEKIISDAHSTIQRFYKVFNIFYPQERNEKTWICSVDKNNEQIVFEQKPFAQVDILEWPKGFISKGDGFSRSWNLLYKRSE